MIINIFLLLCTNTSVGFVESETGFSPVAATRGTRGATRRVRGGRGCRHGTRGPLKELCSEFSYPA